MNRKQFVRTGIFLILAGCILVFLSHLFRYKDTHMRQRRNTYLEQESGAVDAVYIGSSAVDRYWIAAKAFEDYGMTVYPLSYEALPACLTLNTIREALRTQNPKLLILDARMFTLGEKTAESKGAKGVRFFVDDLEFFSPNRFSAIMRSQAFLHELDAENHSAFELSYFFPFVQFHGRWSEKKFSFTELKERSSAYLGFYIHSKLSTKAVSVELLAPDEKREELEEYNIRYLKELLDYLGKEERQVMFIVSPFAASEKMLQKLNSVKDIVEGYGYPFLFCNEKEEILGQLDPEHDFYNTGHVNFDGAVKFTDWFSAYLADHYTLDDHREDPRCESWHGVYDVILKKIEKIRKKRSSS